MTTPAQLSKIITTIFDKLSSVEPEVFTDEVIYALNSDKTKKMVNQVIKKSCSKTDKDKNLPKKAKSSYMFFCDAKREEAKKNLGSNYKNSDIMSELGKMWKEFKDKEENKDELLDYEKMSDDDKKRYKEELDNYEPDNSDDSKPQKQKCPVKKNKTAFMLFSQDLRNEITKEYKLGTFGEISKKLGELWKNSDENTINKYKNLAEEDKERYTKELKEYLENN